MSKQVNPSIYLKNVVLTFLSLLTLTAGSAQAGKGLATLLTPQVKYPNAASSIKSDFSQPVIINSGTAGSPILATIPMPSIPPGGNAGATDVQVNVKTNRVYVSNNLSVTVLDGATDTILANIPIPDAAKTNLDGNFGIYQSCVDDVTNTVYSLSENGVVTAMDGAANSIKDSFSPLPVSTIYNVDGIACNPDTGKLYMVLWTPAPSIVVWDTKKRAVVANLTVTNHEEWLAVNRKTNRIYAQTDFEGVVVIDGATDTVIDRIDAGQFPQPTGCQDSGNCVNPGSWLEQIKVDETTNRIYVVGIDDGSLTTIDGNTNSVIGTEYYNYFPYSVGIDPVRNKIYTLDVVFNIMSEVDGVSGNRIRNISVGPGPFPLGCVMGFVQLNPNDACVASSAGTVGGLEGIATNPVNGKIYVTYTGAFNFQQGAPNAYSYLIVIAPNEPTNQNASNPVRVNSANTPNQALPRTAKLATGDGAVDSVFNSQTKMLYIANSGSNSVSAWRTDSQTVIANIPTGVSPRAITLNEPANTLYTFNADGSVSIVDAANNSLTANFPVENSAGGLLGFNPQGIVYSLKTGKLYAINGFNQIDVIDPVSQKLMATIDDADAGNIAINQATNTIYVSQYASGEVWIIDGDTDRKIGVIANAGQPAQPSGCFESKGGPNTCLQMPSGLTKLAVDENLNHLYVLGQYDGGVVTIDVESKQVISTQYVNPGNYGLAVNPNTHAVFVDNVATPALWVLNGESGRSDSIVNFNSLLCDTAGSACFDQTDLKSVTVNPVNGDVYILDQGDLNPNNTSLVYIVNPIANQLILE